MTQQRIDGSDHLGPAGFTRQDLQDMDWSDRSYAGELTRDSLVQLCRALPGGFAPTSSGAPVAVGGACDALAAWDLHENLGSRGGLLFSRFWDYAEANTSLLGVDWPVVFLQPFDAANAVTTPNTLNVASPVVQTALGDAIHDFDSTNIPFDTTLGSRQGVHRNGEFIPIHGGVGDPNGEFNAIYAGFDSTKGYGDVSDGSSFIQVVTWHDATSCPDVHNILTYSLSTNPQSPHYADQTRLFSNKQWVTERFCEADIASASGLQTLAITQAGVAGVTAPVTAAPPAPPLLPNTSAALASGAAAAAIVGCLVALSRRRRRMRG
jgi:acyl-homoserine-lactone acylase